MVGYLIVTAQIAAWRREAERGRSGWRWLVSDGVDVLRRGFDADPHSWVKYNIRINSSKSHNKCVL